MAHCACAVAQSPVLNSTDLKVRNNLERLRVPLHPHALRHAHATALLRQGSSTEIIRQSLSHSSIQTTQRYLHGDMDLLRTALEQLSPLDTRSRRPTSMAQHLGEGVPERSAVHGLASGLRVLREGPFRSRR